MPGIYFSISMADASHNSIAVLLRAHRLGGGKGGEMSRQRPENSERASHVEPNSVLRT
jgi:hypothetical protein